MCYNFNADSSVGDYRWAPGKSTPLSSSSCQLQISREISSPVGNQLECREREGTEGRNMGLTYLELEVENPSVPDDAERVFSSR